jgi:uncharacterized coiled-coil protein SlyX
MDKHPTQNHEVSKQEIETRLAKLEAALAEKEQQITELKEAMDSLDKTAAIMFSVLFSKTNGQTR